jgi:hypothetical protein
MLFIQVARPNKVSLLEMVSSMPTPAMTAVIFASLRGTVRIKSVCAMAKIAGTKNGRVSATCL